VKQIHKEKLQQELRTYCKQIGIIGDQIPYLTFDPREYINRLKAYYDDEAQEILGRAGRLRKIRSSSLGRCHEQSKTLLVNQNCRGHTWEYDRNSKGNKIRKIMHGQTYFLKRKRRINYRVFKNTLIHELVHYRFPKMQHGSTFEKRIKEILRGEVYPDMRITKADNTNKANQ
jgi:hypothetical protein